MFVCGLAFTSPPQDATIDTSTGLAIVTSVANMPAAPAQGVQVAKMVAGVVDTSFTGAVTINVVSGPGSIGGNTVNASGGYATFGISGSASPLTLNKTGAYQLQATSSGVTPSPVASVFIGDGTLNCGDQLSMTFTNPSNLPNTAPGWASGFRGTNNKDGSNCLLVDYDFTNNVFSPVYPNSVLLTWDTALQPNAAYNISFNTQAEPVDTTTGLPTVKTPKVAWKFNADGSPKKINGLTCAAIYTQQLYGALTTDVAKNTGSITLTVALAPPAMPFAIAIDGEPLVVSAGASSTLGSQTWTLQAATKAAHSMGAQVLNRPPTLPEPLGTIATVGGIGAGDTSITLNLLRDLPATPFAVVIEQERVKVTAVSGNVLTVTRGDGLTTPASHAQATNVMSSPLPLIPAAIGTADYPAGTPAHMCIWEYGYFSAGMNASGVPQIIRFVSGFDIGDGYIDSGD
jgi:hypothetical protein